MRRIRARFAVILKPSFSREFINNIVLLITGQNTESLYITETTFTQKVITLLKQDGKYNINSKCKLLFCEYQLTCYFYMVASNKLIGTIIIGYSLNQFPSFPREV